MPRDRFGWIEDETVRSQLARVDETLRRVALPPSVAAVVHEQLASARSKRLRPALLLLSARFGPAQPRESLIRAAAAIELVHEGTLCHDDIVDDAGTRRALPSAQARFGVGSASLAGSALFYAAARLGVDLPSHARLAIAETSHRLCSGQLTETVTAGHARMTRRTRVAVMLNKTASLFTLAARLGAGLSRTPQPTAAKLVRFATRLGACFQLADDLHDVLGSQSALGREPGSDLADGIVTLPVADVLAAADSQAAELAALLAAVGVRPRHEVIDRAIVTIAHSPATDGTIATLERWLARTRAELPTTARAVPACVSLSALVDLLLTRADEVRRRAAWLRRPTADQPADVANVA